MKQCHVYSHDIKGVVAALPNNQISNDFFEDFLTVKEINSYLNMHPLGLGDVSDVSNTALFLLSKYSKWITTDLVVDGGYLCQ